MHRFNVLILALTLAGPCLVTTSLTAEPLRLDQFLSQQLTDEYYSEGVSVGDLNQDGQLDVVYGPYWFAGPDYSVKQEIYAPQPQNREGYADHFFAWVRDFDHDGRSDVFVVGFPGTPAYVYQNPGSAGLTKHWPKHQVFDWVSNESPRLVDLIGDETPELVCTRDGFFGYATIDPAAPLEPWTFHPISDKIADGRFGHGLGIGDVNGDGRQDILHAGGWFEQPARLDQAGGRWVAHEVQFTNAYGGAEMYAYDVDGDGDQDVITSLAAHDFGLAWYEQTGDPANRQFVRHDILGATPADNRYGVVFSELHSVNLADIDGDGLKDIVTGKTFYSHHRGSPMWDAGAVVYWFRLVRTPEGVDWLPYRAAADVGIGRQVGVFDVNADQLPDVVVGGMKGCHVLRHTRQDVTEGVWKAAQPTPYQPTAAAATPASPDMTAGLMIEAEKLPLLEITSGKAAAQSMTSFSNDRWSGDAQLFWTGGKPGAKLVLELTVPAPGTYQLVANMTKARDYAIVQVSLDDEPLGAPLDLFSPSQVVTTGLLTFPARTLDPGKHRVTWQITGANPAAVQAMMVGLDNLQFARVAE